jgi:sulfoquinovose isomerase
VTADWRRLPAHRSWLAGQAQDLLTFFLPTLDPTGRFIELDDDGRALTDGGEPQRLLTVARAVHCYSLGELLGTPGCHAIAARGLETLWVDHRDAATGGYLSTIGRDGPPETAKAAYDHAFVLLAASSAMEAGHDGARALWDDVLEVIEEHFWSDEEGAAREAFDRDWHELEAYRGANSNMHLCEGFLAAADVGDRPDLAQRAARIARLLIDGRARANDWLIPEHYDTDWRPDHRYHRDRPDDPFRPYGASIGHSLEWARLLLTTSLATRSGDGWFLEAAEALFERAVTIGWDRCHGGLVYTIGFDGEALNDDHYWWPIAEGIAAATWLAEATGNPKYEQWYRRFWEYASTVLIDHRRGGWYPEFDRENHRKVGPWHGKPDLYHALQASILPGLPLAPSVAGAIRRHQQRVS